jgi:hypothetical protein
MSVAMLEEARDFGIHLTLPQISRLDYEGSGQRPNQALELLKKRSGDAEILQESIEVTGARKMVPFAWGSNALLMYTTLGQLARVVPTGCDLFYGPELNRPCCPRMLDSILPAEEVKGATAGKGWKIEYLNRLPGKHGNTTALKELKVFLAYLGFRVWDDNPNNIMLLPDKDETPIFVDPDVVSKPLPGDADELCQVEYLSRQELPPHYWGEREDRRTWKQVHCFPQLDPDSPNYRKLLGLVSSYELELLRKEKGPRHPLVTSIADERLYPAELPEDLLSQLQDFLYERIKRVLVTTEEITPDL